MGTLSLSLGLACLAGAVPSWPARPFLIVHLAFSLPFGETYFYPLQLSVRLFEQRYILFLDQEIQMTTAQGPPGTGFVSLSGVCWGYRNEESLASVPWDPGQVEKAEENQQLQ